MTLLQVSHPITAVAIAVSLGITLIGTWYFMGVDRKRRETKLKASYRANVNAEVEAKLTDPFTKKLIRISQKEIELDEHEVRIS